MKARCCLRIQIESGHLSIYVLWEVIGQQVVIAAGCDGGDHGLEKVVPAKLALLDKISHPLIPGVQLQEGLIS